MSVVEIRTALEGLLKVVETIARHTPTVWDDQFTAVVKSLLEVPALLELVAYLLGDSQVQTLRDEARTERIQRLATTHAASPSMASVSFAIVLQYLPLIVRLLLSLLGRR